MYETHLHVILASEVMIKTSIINLMNLTDKV